MPQVPLAACHSGTHITETSVTLFSGRGRPRRNLTHGHLCFMEIADNTRLVFRMALE